MTGAGGRPVLDSPGMSDPIRQPPDGGEFSDLVRDAARSGATPEEIAEALGAPLETVRGALRDSRSPLADTQPAGEVVRQQIARAERAVAAAEAAGDTAGARVWAGIVSRLVPLLVRVEEAQQGEGLTIARSEIAAAEAHVRKMVELAVKGECEK